MPEQVYRFVDPDKRSREADACGPRNPAEADVIMLPVIRRTQIADNQPTMESA